MKSEDLKKQNNHVYGTLRTSSVIVTDNKTPLQPILESLVALVKNKKDPKFLPCAQVRFVVIED